MIQEVSVHIFSLNVDLVDSNVLDVLHSFKTKIILMNNYGSDTVLMVLVGGVVYCCDMQGRL